MKKTLLFKALDSVAGGIEKVLHLDKGRCGCDAMVCDDGCDAAMMGELLVPMPPASHSFHHSEPMNSAALEQWQQTPPVVAPRTQMRMSQPRMAPQSGRAIPQAQPEPQATGEPSQRSMPAQRSTPAQRSEPVQRSMPSQGVPAPPIPEDESDSLFDALSNPFSDDEVHVRRFNPVRPSNYQRDSNLPKETLSRSHQTSSRRVRRSQ